VSFMHIWLFVASMSLILTTLYCIDISADNYRQPFYYLIWLPVLNVLSIAAIYLIAKKWIAVAIQDNVPKSNRLTEMTDLRF
jgi:hypothetical protein